MPATTDPSRARRIELILQQLDSLPTLPGVAMRLLQLTSSDDSEANEVIELVRDDQAISSKVLALCRFADKGVDHQVVTVDRAVLLLGFEAVRNAVLSIKVFETFAEKGSGRDGGETVDFDRRSFWRHSLAVAIAAEMIVANHPDADDLRSDEVFVCGLLHDLGKLALDYVLPKSYQRVIELTEQGQADIAEVERRVIGIDHHRTGKRLAEHWQLPHVLQDVMWLHGTPLRMLPALEHRRMVGLVSLADLLVRRQHIGYSGNYELHDDIDARSEALGFDPEIVRDTPAKIHEELERRATALGLGETPSRELFLASIMQANTVLGRLNRQLGRRRQTSAGQAKVLEAVAAFHERSSHAARSVQDVLAATVASAQSVFGGGFYAMLYQAEPGEPWLIVQYGPEGQVTRSEFAEPPPHTKNLTRIADGDHPSIDLMGVLPWISDYLMESRDLRQVRLLPLPCGGGTAAVMLHDQSTLPGAAPLRALTNTWGAAVAAATQHEGARRLGEQLAEANQDLAATQDTLLRTQSLARLGEMAAGAAHEMNNPLAVISGRAQLLANRLPAGGKDRQAAQLIAEQSEKLSDLITALRLFAEPPQPKMKAVALADVIEDAVHNCRRQFDRAPALQVSTVDNVPLLWSDGRHVSGALEELLLNAMQAKPKSAVKLRIQIDPLNGRLNFKVIDDGMGMDAHTLEHAMDPFFSEKEAGRRSGLGLAKASRLIELVGGEIHLASEPGRGTTATMSIPLVDPPHDRTLATNTNESGSGVEKHDPES